MSTSSPADPFHPIRKAQGRMRERINPGRETSAEGQTGLVKIFDDYLKKYEEVWKAS